MAGDSSYAPKRTEKQIREGHREWDPEAGDLSIRAVLMTTEKQRREGHREWDPGAGDLSIRAVLMTVEEQTPYRLCVSPQGARDELPLRLPSKPAY